MNRNGYHSRLVQAALTTFSSTASGFVALVGCCLVALITVAQVDFSKMQRVAQERYGQSAVELVVRWELEIDAMKVLPDGEKLERANRFFNDQIRWVTDDFAWREQDYWATPLEVMGTRMGDCEDFAIAKYAMLVLAGIDVNKLRITYVKASLAAGARTRTQAHMVLAYYPTASSEPLVLDNLVPDILAASDRVDLVPVYGFNSQGIWVGGQAKPASTEPEARLSRWRNLLRRAAAEGLG